MKHDRKPKHDCPCCTCGLYEVDWSDRHALVDLIDPEDIARVISNCALDHSYDRTKSGVPWGLPTDIENAAIPVVAKHLSAIRPDWKDNTVDMNKDELEAFEKELVSAITPFIEKV